LIRLGRFALAGGLARASDSGDVIREAIAVAYCHIEVTPGDGLRLADSQPLAAICERMRVVNRLVNCAFAFTSILASGIWPGFGAENQRHSRPKNPPASRPIPIDPGKGDGKPVVTVRDHRAGNGGSGGTTVTSSSTPRNVWKRVPASTEPIVRDHRQPTKVPVDPLAGSRRPSWKAAPTSPLVKPVPEKVVVRDHRDDASRIPVIVRDHRAPTGHVIRDHRTPKPEPIVRDHRTENAGPIIRDHRTPAAGTIVRDHRQESTGPVIRDHR
jgi:hypothetical protein